MGQFLDEEGGNSRLAGPRIEQCDEAGSPQRDLLAGGEGEQLRHDGGIVFGGAAHEAGAGADVGVVVFTVPFLGPVGGPLGVLIGVAAVA